MVTEFKGQGLINENYLHMFPAQNSLPRRPGDLKLNSEVNKDSLLANMISLLVRLISLIKCYVEPAILILASKETHLW